MTYVYNTSTSTATAKAPFELVMNRVPNAVIRDRIGDKLKGIKMEVAEDLRTKLQETHKLVHTFNENKKQYEEELANRSRATPSQYSVGDMIWVSSHYRLETGAKLKLSAKWRGPWVVTAVRSKVTVAARAVGSDEASSSMHVNNIKPFLTRTGGAANIAVSVLRREEGLDNVEDFDHEPPAPEDNKKKSKKSQRPELFEVEQVLKHRFVGTQELEFLVQWKGYVKPTWIREHEAVCSDLVEAYFQAIK